MRITPSTAHKCTTIVEELAERDRRKRNIVMYNLPEGRDRKADKASALSLIKSVYNLESPITRVDQVHLGKKDYYKDKHRPLLVCFENVDDKAVVLSQAYLLHQKEQFKMVFVAPDRTKLKREKHQRLVAELKERKSKGENLMIRNGQIIARHTPRED